MPFTCLVIPLFSVPEEYKCGKSLGPVESLQEHPQDSDKILIGYSRGLVVLWDLNSRHVDNLFLGKQVGLCVSLFDVSQMVFNTLWGCGWNALNWNRNIDISVLKSL